MKNLIKSIDYNRELENPFINVELEDGRFALVQLEKNTNRLDAGFGEYYIDIDSSGSEDNYDLIEEDLANDILAELRKRFSEEVRDFEEVFSFEVGEFLEKIQNY